MNTIHFNCHDGILNHGGNVIRCGIDNFDDSIAKIKLRQLLIVTGKPDMGKTAFSITAMCNMALNDRIPVAIFSLEMSNVQVAQRIIMNTLKVRFPFRQSNDTELQELTTRIFNKLRGVPIYLDDTAPASIDEIINKIQELKTINDVKVFFIDYINLIIDFPEKKLEIMRRLKDTASRLQVSIVANCGLSKGQDIAIPSNSKSSLASCITEVLTVDCFEIADNVCLLNRPGYYNQNQPKDIVEMYIMDNGCKTIDKLCLTFYPEYAQIIERKEET